MRKHYAFALALLFSFIIAGAAIARGIGKLTEDNNSSVPTIGSTIADFKLPDAEGHEHSLSSLKGKNGTVLIFISTRCPVSNGYNERMEKLWQDYQARGISLIGINANKTESADDIKAHAAQNNLTFTILRDKGNKIADRLGAERTPEVFFLDASNKLVYHGR